MLCIMQESYLLSMCAQEPFQWVQKPGVSVPPFGCCLCHLDLLDSVVRSAERLREGELCGLRHRSKS